MDKKLGMDGLLFGMNIVFITFNVIAQEKARLDDLRKNLDEDRARFTQAAVRLSKERAEIEVSCLRINLRKSCLEYFS